MTVHCRMQMVEYLQCFVLHQSLFEWTHTADNNSDIIVFIQNTNTVQYYVFDHRSAVGTYIITCILVSCKSAKLFKYVDVNFDDFFQHSTAVTTRGHPFKLFKCHSDVNIRKSF